MCPASNIRCYHWIRILNYTEAEHSEHSTPKSTLVSEVIVSKDWSQRRKGCEVLISLSRYWSKINAIRLNWSVECAFWNNFWKKTKTDEMPSVIPWHLGQVAAKIGPSMGRGHMERLVRWLRWAFVGSSISRLASSWWWKSKQNIAIIYVLQSPRWRHLRRTHWSVLRWWMEMRCAPFGLFLMNRKVAEVLSCFRLSSRLIKTSIHALNEDLGHI